jgi:hypothetical protein
MKFNKGIIFGIQLYLLKTNTYWVNIKNAITQELNLSQTPKI